MCVYMHICVCVYLSIREELFCVYARMYMPMSKELLCVCVSIYEETLSLSLSLSLCVCVCGCVYAQVFQKW